MKSSIIIGTGSYLPLNILTNNDLAKRVDTNDEWIKSRTGIKQRHIVAEDETTSDMSFRAAEAAIASAKITNEEIDMVIVGTTTPDQTFPSVAVKVQAKLGIKNIPAFDCQAVCSGFIYALTIADNFIKSGFVKTILVIGADSMSKITDWSDRGTCILFGDGAGAIILRADESNREGIIKCQLQADGCYENILYADGGGTHNNPSGVVRMAGREVFKHAVEKMSSAMLDVLSQTKYLLTDVNWVIPHQANARIIEAIATRLSVPHEKLVITVENQANTSAATIPLALDHHVKAGMIKSQDLIMLSALGGGLTWGACLLRWV